MPKAIVALVLASIFGGCERATKPGLKAESKSSENIPSDISIYWGSKDVVVITKNVEVDGQQVKVKYVIVLRTTTTFGDQLFMYYPNAHIVFIYDYNQNQKADEILVPGTYTYKRGEPGTDSIFVKADRMMARFRKELAVDEVIRAGPRGPPDPFVAPSGH